MQLDPARHLATADEELDDIYVDATSVDALYADALSCRCSIFR